MKSSGDGFNDGLSKAKGRITEPKVISEDIIQNAAK